MAHFGKNTNLTYRIYFPGHWKCVLCSFHSESRGIILKKTSNNNIKNQITQKQRKWWDMARVGLKREQKLGGINLEDKVSMNINFFLDRTCYFVNKSNILHFYNGIF